MDDVTRRKWDKVARNFEVMAGYGPEKRWAPYKEELFGKMGVGNILFLALGTGLDIPVFPKGKNITAIDISQKMIDQAQERLEGYDGQISAQQVDVHDMPFEDNSFDQVFTSCTFCSVPNPIDGLKALQRVLKPGGDLYMFEHTGSRYFPFRPMMNVMTMLTSRLGPDMNRTTVENVKAAGYELKNVTHVYLDVVKTIHATNAA